MPGSSSKNKDTSAVETGRPFSPAMFEGVLKSFTPDVPSTISGRPRFVFDLGQYFSVLHSVISSLLILPFLISCGLSYLSIIFLFLFFDVGQ